MLSLILQEQVKLSHRLVENLVLVEAIFIVKEKRVFSVHFSQHFHFAINFQGSTPVFTCTPSAFAKTKPNKTYVVKQVKLVLFNPLENI